MRRRTVRRVTIFRDALEATGRPGMWLFLRVCSWEGVTPVEQPTIRLALSLAKQGQLHRASIVLHGIGMDLQRS
jgi:hypothetical protein